MSVLSVLTGADAQFTVTQIQRLLHGQGSLPGIRKALAPLVAQGLVDEFFLGKTGAYSLNRDHLLAEPLLQMANAKARLFSKIRALVDSWPIEPTVAMLFGSGARGDMHLESDIDILLIFTDAADQDSIDQAVYALSQKVSRWTGNDVRPLLYRESDVSPAPIFSSILSEGITLTGDSNWLRRALRQHLVTL